MLICDRYSQRRRLSGVSRIVVAQRQRQRSLAACTHWSHGLPSVALQSHHSPAHMDTSVDKGGSNTTKWAVASATLPAVLIEVAPQFPVVRHWLAGAEAVRRQAGAAVKSKHIGHHLRASSAICMQLNRSKRKAIEKKFSKNNGCLRRKLTAPATRATHIHILFL